MDTWYTSLYKGFIITSVLLFLISLGTTGETNIGAVIAGFSVLTVSILMIMTDLLAVVVPSLRGASMFKSFLSILLTAGPFILMLAIIGFVIYLLVTYMNEIIAGHVSSTYGSISNALIIIFLAQIYVLFTAITSESFVTTKKVNKLSSMVLYLLNIIGVVCTIIMLTVLKYYTTDG